MGNAEGCAPFLYTMAIIYSPALRRAVQMFAECSSTPAPSDLPWQVFPLKVYNKHPFYHSTSQNLTASYSVSAPDPYLTDSHLPVQYILL